MKKGIIAVLSGITGGVVGAASVAKIGKSVLDNTDKKVSRLRSYYNMLNQWLVLKQEGKSLEKYFIDNNYKTIAIYGMGEIGTRLYEDLKNTNIEIRYAIDQNVAGTYSDLEVLDKDGELAEVDVVVVTPIFAFDEIEKELSERVDFPIVSLEDVLYEV